MQKIVITKKLPFDISAYLTDFRVEANTSHEQLPLLRLRQMVSDADAMITSSSDIIDKTLMDSSPKLKVIANYSTGFANIDIEYARKKGITVCTANNALTQNTAELIFALLLSCSKFVTREDRIARNEDQQTIIEGHKPLGLYKKTLGILGMDNIGQATAKIATGFSMDVIYNDARRNYQSELLLGATFANFNEILEWSDFLVISTLFDDFIKDKIVYDKFKQMKKSAVIVSLGTGTTVDRKDLVSALQKKLITAAGLNIGEFSKQEADILKTMDNVALISNNQGGSAQSVGAEMAKICADCIISVLRDGIVPDSAVTNKI